MLENRIAKLENDIQQLRTELSIAIEFYAEVREFLNDLLQLAKTNELKKQEFEYSKPTSILELTSSIQNTKSKSRIDMMLEKCIDLVFKDYKEQCERE
jgi:DNA replication initiation complex subunit (GINS family)